MDQSAHGEDPNTVATDLVDPTANSAQAAPSDLLTRPRAGLSLTTRGTILVIMVPLLVVGVFGLFQQATILPGSLGLTLIISSAVAAWLARPSARWVAVVCPPLVLALVVIVLGQVTLLGSGYSPTRELAMFATAMVSYAPAQLLAVGAAGLIFYLKQRREAAARALGAGGAA
ncbi:MAG: hypothetical protein KDC39_08925 [Actinobacteria bacterium]|nr:hypothetical protein [Actinomycetota bacterium]